MSNQLRLRSRAGAAGYAAVLSALVLALLGARGASAAPAALGAPAGQQAGAQIYQQYCLGCHQDEGTGVAGVYPPLDGSEWVAGDAGSIIRILLHGISGPIMVQGEEYTGLMPAWGAALTTAEIASVATYVRGAWGNTAGPVTEAQVAQVRAANAARTTPWTAQELTAARASK